MTPIDQTRFAIELPLTEAPGNCWAACIASVLEVPLTEVPDESDYWKPGMSHRDSWRPYQKAVFSWLRNRGYVTIEIPEKQVFFSGDTFNPLVILSGPSPRNSEVNHAVVGRGREIIHDPHPSRDGLARIDGKDWWYEILVPVDPSKMRLA